MMFRSGHAAILGRPNAGKSTLLNTLVGEKVAIVTSKPQTTRDSLRGIVTRDDCQIVLVDTPGIMTPRDRLNEALMVNVHEALHGVDVALHLMDSTEKPKLTDSERKTLASVPCPRLTVLTKIDRPKRRLDLESWRTTLGLEPEAEIFPISAVTGEGIEALVDAVSRHLPEGPPLFDPEQLTDKDLRYLVGEIVREKVLECLGQELPYAAAVTIEQFEEREGEHTLIVAVIHMEQESQKGMVVGKGGQMIKRIGQAARVDMEQLLQGPVYLDLRVKVRKNWRRRDDELKRFGFRPPKTSSR
jgi:GTP-binding protein Era